MQFKFKAQKASGEFYEGVREAVDRYALARECKSAGETLLSAREIDAAHSIDWARFLNLFGRISIHDKVVFARNLGGMLGAGLPISRALWVLDRQTKNAKLKTVVSELSLRISSGETLSQALEEAGRVFPPLFVAMVKAGEESGNLGGSLIKVSEQLDRSYLLRRKVKGAMVYPSIVLGIMFIIGILMLIFIVPQITGSFKEFGVDLPLSTRLIIEVSDFISAHTVLGFLLIALLIVGFLGAAQSARGKRTLDFFLLRLPVIAPIVKETNAARTGETLASLLSAGVEAVQALRITADTLQNSYYKAVLLSASEAISKGEPMSAVFRANEHLYPPALPEMMAVGEETGKLSVMLREIGNFFEAEVEQKTKNLSTIVEPVLMVVVGVAVGFFSLAMITPMYSLMNSI